MNGRVQGWMVKETVDVVEENVMKEYSERHVSENFGHSGEKCVKFVHRLSPKDDHSGMDGARDDLITGYDGETIPKLGWRGLLFKLLEFVSSRELG